MYRFVATDLDGTLIDRSLRISPRTQKAIQLAQHRGSQVVISTGRMYQSALPFAKALGITAPLITYQGALARDPQTNEELWHHRMPLERTREALKMLQAAGLHINLYVDDCLYVEELTPEAKEYRDLTGVEPVVIPSFEEVLGHAPTKILAIGSSEAVIHWDEALKIHFGESLYVTPSQAHYLELAAPGVTKGAAITRLAARFGISPEEIVAFGDGHNDLEMLSAAGLGVAMGNAGDRLKSVANRIAPPVWEEGVASVLEELFA